MSYIKPNGSDDRYDVTGIIPTKTQHGYDAVVFLGDDLPDDLHAGFKYYDDNDNLISDLSKFNDYYTHNVYSVKKDTIVQPKPNNTPSGISNYGGDSSAAIMEQIASLNEQIEEMQPYTASKPVYIEEYECFFDKVRDGAISASLVSDGVEKECQYEVIDDKIRVFFEPLIEVGTVTIIIQ